MNSGGNGKKDDLRAGLKFSSDTPKPEPKVVEVTEGAKEEVKIEEEPIQPQPNPQHFPGIPGMPPNMANPGANMSDDQMQFACDMMKNNPEMMANMMKAQGMNMSEDQIKLMSQFMTPEMLKTAGQMRGGAPGMPGQPGTPGPQMPDPNNP